MCAWSPLSAYSLFTCLFTCFWYVFLAGEEHGELKSLALLGSYNLLLFTIYQIQAPFLPHFNYFFFLFGGKCKNKYKTYLKFHHWFNIIFPKQTTTNNNLIAVKSYFCIIICFNLFFFKHSPSFIENESRQPEAAFDRSTHKHTDTHISSFPSPIPDMRPIFPDKVLPLRNSSWSGLVCSLPLVLPVGKLLYQFTPSISPATQITHIPQTADSEIRFVLTLSPFLRLTLSVPALFFLPFCYFFILRSYISSPSLFLSHWFCVLDVTGSSHLVSLAQYQEGYPKVRTSSPHFL